MKFHMTVGAKERHLDKHEKYNEAIQFHRNKMHPVSCARSACISFVLYWLNKKAIKNKNNASGK